MEQTMEYRTTQKERELQQIMEQTMEYRTTQKERELQQIVDLQQRNLAHQRTADELESQGFVTVTHDLELLQSMGRKYGHIVAIASEKVVGYALIMTQEFGDKIPALIPMFEQFNHLSVDAVSLSERSYFVMGQVCVDIDYRGKGVFRGLYQQMKNEMSSRFDCIVTEVSTRNTRSLNAHHAIGFKSLHQYCDNHEEWDILLWDWEKNH